MGLVGRRMAVLLGGAALAVIATSVALKAQETEGEPTTNEAEKTGRVTLLQKIVVGAGVEKVAIDTPQSVTVVEQREIDEEQAATIGDVVRDIPGVNVTGSDRMLGQSINIRGIGAPENAGDGGRIIINVDGVQKFYEQYRMGSFFSDPELYKRVEVLRGPASSTLYGSGALGGVVNFETKDASDFIADGQTGALRLKGSYNSNRADWLTSVVLAQRFGVADFLLTGNYRLADTYLTGDGTEVVGSNFRTWSGLAKGTFKVGEEGTLRLSYQHWDSDLEDQELSQTSTATFFGLIDRHVVDKTAIAAYENPFSDNDMLDLKVALSYSATSNEQRDADLRAMCSPGSFAVVCDSDYAYDTWQFNAQNTMEWRGDGWENFLTVGSQSSFQTRTADAYFNSGTPFPVTFHPEGTDLKSGLFVQNEFIWDNRLTLIPGVRFDWHRLTPDGNVIDPGTGLTAASSDDTAISPKIAAHYTFSDTVAVFGSIAHTERFPTIDEVFALSRYDLFQAGDAGQVKVTGFYNDITDLIALALPFSPGFNDRPGFVNINRAEIYGVEVEAAYEADYLFANAAYTWLMGKDKTTGAYLQTLAPHELALTLGGQWPEHDLRFGWKARIVAEPQDPARRAHPPLGTATPDPPPKAVPPLLHSWTPKEGRFTGWETQLGVENIFDRQYKEFLMNDDARGRTFKISLSRQFGW